MINRVWFSVLASLSLLSFHLLARGAEPPHNGGNATPTSNFEIPGPQRSLLRMAGVSQKAKPEEVLPLLSRNVFMEGFEGANHPTEFLLLLRRYVVQARELAALAAKNNMVIRVANCDDAGPLLQILGYRTSLGCGNPTTVLQTADAERAFLAIDSGFPLPELERTVQGGQPFEYPYNSSPVPVLFAESDWTQAARENHKENSRDLIETILRDPQMARLYWAFAHLEPETARVLRQEVGLEKLLPYAAELDFYGRGLNISGGRVVVPGGPAAEPAWKDLVGANPASPASFIPRLLAKDKGWLAAYYDVLTRTRKDAQPYFTNPQRLRLFYEGVKAAGLSIASTKGAFRPAPAMLMLGTRLQFDKDGQPLVPGGLEVWRDVLQQSRDSRRSVRKLANSGNVSNTDQFIQALFALSRSYDESGPLECYLAIAAIDGRRPSDRRLLPTTVRVLVRRFEEFSDQYRFFSEFPELSDESIVQFLQVAQQLNTTPSNLRANAYGIFQANLGIWQILARQGQIASPKVNESWQRVIRPFANVRNPAQLYDSGRASLGEIFRYSTGKPSGSQDDIIDLLAGPQQTTPEGQEMHREIAQRIRAVLDDQRLVSLDALLTVGDALVEKGHGGKPPEYAVMMAAQTREFQMPQPIFTNGERTEWAAGIYNNHHTDVEMKSDLPGILKSSSASREQVADARGQLAAFLRDTLVGLNYAYYEPPGAQALHNNPLFVRSHDFAGETLTGLKNFWQAPELLGQGSPAGGGAHFVGSLADLPYVLAELEQDFISPDNVQALVWRELAPEVLISSILPRWWNVSPVELHAVALYQRSGEELLTASAKDEALQKKVLAILSDRLLPQDYSRVERALTAGKAADLISEMMPADMLYLAAEFQTKYPDQSGDWGTALQELRDSSRQHPDQINWARLSRDFGTPHPALAQNYGLELLNVPPLPPFSGTASRYLAESWDSPNLYWARLADEQGYSPVVLNQLVPRLTRVMVEKIFATDFEDWPALLRAMRETGQEFRDGKLKMPQKMISSARP